MTAADAVMMTQVPHMDSASCILRSMARNPTRMTLTASAQHIEYARVQAFIERACAQAGCSDAQRLRLLLVIEELFTNTVKYGRSVAPPVSVAISVEVEGSHGLTVRYEDTAPPYDPFEDAGVEEDLSVSVSKRRIGGLGIVLVRELSQDVQYAWSEGKNRVTFVVPLAPS